MFLKGGKVDLAPPYHFSKSGAKQPNVDFGSTFF
jgi:hypothetical protein